MRNVLEQYNCVLLCGCEVAFWNNGRIGTEGADGVFGCEGEEVTREWTELFIEGRLYCSVGTEVHKMGRECSIHEWM